ncbi:MAG: DUF86 domain-containing protein [Desulfarculaceae bacterium]|nr:DUF86 domain-containing protein [Desulfarculaceae bacterium]MCF8072427.1 DUF86 domain-containing protein [Desulfarculaceae bacterium]MCF8102888.1 DUF86 domain-containing protein [Desulfarculaceae bacterium]MCF8118470.1 DUF86 domain-containing protein [Desulfarculaceae bacterium]
MKRDYADYIADMAESAKDIMAFTKGMTFDEFSADKKTQYAVIRSLEILGEAAKKIPDSIRKKYPSVPWKQMAGTRDKLIHEYHGVDLAIIWAVVEDELPKVIEEIEEMAADIL